MTTRRVLHTSDWHLGQSFHGFDRTWEHEQFLDWLVTTIVDQEIDAVLVSGDIFDTINAPNAAQRLWFDFLGKVLVRRPGCDVVAIAGNHDSAARLDAPEALTRALGLAVVGSPRNAEGVFDARRLIVPLGARSARGEAGVWGHVAALPFFRGDDLGTLTELHGEGAYLERVRLRHAETFAALDAVRAPGLARMGMFHGVLQGATQRSDRSERDVRVGNVEGIPEDLFPNDLGYLALGHLHRPQRVRGQDHVRYAGSPLPLHVSEADYPHQVVLVSFEDGVRTGIESLRIPQHVPVVRIPAAGQSLPTMDEVLAVVNALPSRVSEPVERQPYVEVRFVPDSPRVGFSNEVASAAASRGYRLTTVRSEQVRDPGAAPAPMVSLTELEPEQVFGLLYARTYKGAAPPDDLLRAFHELLAQVQGAQEPA